MLDMLMLAMTLLYTSYTFSGTALAKIGSGWKA